jgi:uncharacterized RDD family membrane protein YckC
MKKTASLFKRNIAQFIDMVLLILILMLNGAIVFVLKVYYPYDLISYFLIGFIFFVFNNAYMQGSKGFTVGKAFLKIKVVDNIGCPIGVSKSFIREFAKLYTPLTLFIAYFSALGADKRQSWHDRIVDSYVVDDKSSDVYLIN